MQALSCATGWTIKVSHAEALGQQLALSMQKRNMHTRHMALWRPVWQMLGPAQSKSGMPICQRSSLTLAAASQQARLSLLAWCGTSSWQRLGPAQRQAGRHTCCKTSPMLAPYSNCSLSPSSLLFSSSSLLHMPIIWELG